MIYDRPRIRDPGAFPPPRDASCACCALRVPHPGHLAPVLSEVREVAMRCPVQDELVFSRSPRCDHYLPVPIVGSR